MKRTYSDMKKLLIALATTVALVGPAAAGDNAFIRCEAREDGSRVFNSRNLKDLNVWSEHVGPSRYFMVKRAPDALHWQGDLVYPDDFGVVPKGRNVWILSTEWDCKLR